MSLPNRKGSVFGRTRSVPRNDINWFFKYPMNQTFTASPICGALFRITHQLFRDLVDKLRHDLTRINTAKRQWRDCARLFNLTKSYK